jgi:hypothetical protein
MKNEMGNDTPETQSIDTPTKPSLNKHAIYGFLLSCVITPALAIPFITTMFQIRLAKYNIKEGKEPKPQWRSAILTISLVFAIMAIVVVFALMEL